MPRSFHDSNARSSPVNRSLANIRCFAVANRSQAVLVFAESFTWGIVSLTLDSVGSQSMLSGLPAESTLLNVGNGSSSGDGDSWIAGVPRG